MTLEVIYLDNHLLVVNKPPGLLAQADRTEEPDVLTVAKDYLKTKFDKPGNVYVGLVHRLDRPASGLMVLARTSKAAARLSEQFRRRTPQKLYIAMVEGELQGAGLREDYLAVDERTVRVVDASADGAQRAEMQWRAMGYGDGVSLVEIGLKTGRKHQIRVQLAAMGHPIVGDIRYGAKRKLDGHNLALHCYRLGVTHPIDDEWVFFSAAPPESWQDRFADRIAALLADDNA